MDNGFLDAGDSLGVFGLGSATGLGIANGGALRHSFYLASRVPFDIYATVNSQTRTGTVGAGLSTSDIRYGASAQASGVDDGFAYGGRSTIAGFAPEPIADVGGFDPGPTRVIRFLSQTRTASGNLDRQTVRVTNEYRFSVRSIWALPRRLFL